MKIILLFIIGMAILGQSSARPQRMEGDCSTDDFCIQVPICAIDEEGVPRTFSNACDMNMLNCLRGMNYVQVKIGEC